MKKFGSLLTLLVVSACSSYNYTAYQVTDQDSLKEWAKPFVHTVERAPSSQIVSRPRYFWEADSLKIQLSANTAVNQSYNVKFNQYSVYDVKEKVERIQSQIEVQWVRVNEPVLVCDEESGSGRSELWDAFYSAPGSKKASTLALAIEGIGNTSAQSLVKNGYFHSKPRNWRDFESEIKRAEQANVITGSVRYQVLYQYRAENMTKLGYNTQLSGACRFEVESYVTPREVLVNRRVLEDVVVTKRDLISSETKNYQISVSGHRLQPFENEMLVFSFNKESNQVSLAQAAYNNYSIAFDGRKITVVGISRKSVKLPSDVLPRGATLEASGGQARFTAPVNRLYIPKSKTEGHLLISIQVISCKKGMLGGCSITNSDEKVQPTVVKDVLPTMGIVNHTFTTSPGRKYYVKYWANTSNSPWYINNVVKAPTKPEL